MKLSLDSLTRPGRFTTLPMFNSDAERVLSPFAGPRRARETRIGRGAMAAVDSCRIRTDPLGCPGAARLLLRLAWGRGPLEVRAHVSVATRGLAGGPAAHPVATG